MAHLKLFCLAGILPAFLLCFSNPARGGDPCPDCVRNSVREVRIPDNRKILALTFDLCEGPGKTAGFDSDLVEFLAGNSVKATFFAGGKWMRSHPEETMRLLENPLFQIGNHSWDHPNFRRLGTTAAREQIIRTREEYIRLRNILVGRLEAAGWDRSRTAIIPQAPDLFRFPYGACKSESLALVADLGMTAIQWSIVSGDPDRNRTSEGIIRTVLAQARPGSIIIFHANGKGRGTLGALRVVVPRLRSQGYVFTTIGELLSSGNPISVPECYELKPGDTLRYDRDGRAEP